MANLTLRKNTWNPNIHQIELDDPVEGGPDGGDNKAPKQLGENALYLKDQIDAAVGGDTSPTGGFSLKMLDGKADQIDGAGRDLLKVLGVSTIQAAVDEISTRCNGTGTPNFSGLMIGDYLDGIDLSAIPAENGGDAGQAWNNSYKNNRIIISGFNIYKGFGDTEIKSNHIMFTFRNIPIRKRMNSTDDNSGGYTASELRAFLEGVNGDGTGDMDGVTTAAFMKALNAQFGEGHLLTLRKVHSTKGGQDWRSYTVFLPSELEVIGYPTYGDEGVYIPALTSPVLPARAGYNTNVQFPLFSKSGIFRIKRYNGGRNWWWTQTPAAFSPARFAFIYANGHAHYLTASSLGGCAPAFCVV